MADEGSHIQIAETRAGHIHGNTAIKPGDKVKTSRRSNRLHRVIETYPDKSKLLVYKSGAVHASVEKIYAEGVVDYEPRE
jgi:hypothetical protein